MNNYEDYVRYIRSSKWLNLKKKVFRYKGKICRKCGRRKSTQVHHKTYERLGKEQLSDLVPVCRVCHKKIHSK